LLSAYDTRIRQYLNQVFPDVQGRREEERWQQNLGPACKSVEHESVRHLDLDQPACCHSASSTYHPTRSTPSGHLQSFVTTDRAYFRRDYGTEQAKIRRLRFPTGVW
jgi:hypothetical protein